MALLDKRLVATIAAATFVLVGAGLRGQQPDQKSEEGAFRFRSGVELINVTATVVDDKGRFVSGLRQEDFSIFEDGEPQSITHFSNERVPVSLGIALDTSGSMAGEKLSTAQRALDRFLFELLDASDEIFLYAFDTYPDLIQEWTSDRKKLSRALDRVSAGGGTAMLDALAEAIPLAQTGEKRKKAVLVISDGNDTDSQTTARELKQMIRETEVLVYAIGIDGRTEATMGTRMPLPIPFPLPMPGGRRGPWRIPPPPTRPGGSVGPMGGEGVNAGALREITDESGGRTEVIRSIRDLAPATAGIADELSRQYYLGYAAPGKQDGRWHTIRVETREKSLRVRARRGYIATP